MSIFGRNSRQACNATQQSGKPAIFLKLNSTKDNTPVPPSLTVNN